MHQKQEYHITELPSSHSPTPLGTLNLRAPVREKNSTKQNMPTGFLVKSMNAHGPINVDQQSAG